MLDLRRRIKAVIDVLDAMIRNGVSLARSIELTVQCECVLRVGPVPPISLEDFECVRGVDIGEFRRLIGDMHRRLSDFVHRVVREGSSC